MHVISSFKNLTQNYNSQNLREIPSAKFTGKILRRICIPKFYERYKILLRNGYEIPRQYSCAKFQTLKFGTEFRAVKSL